MTGETAEETHTLDALGFARGSDDRCVALIRWRAIKATAEDWIKADTSMNDIARRIMGTEP